MFTLVKALFRTRKQKNTHSRSMSSAPNSQPSGSYDSLMNPLNPFSPLNVTRSQPWPENDNAPAHRTHSDCSSNHHHSSHDSSPSYSSCDSSSYSDSSSSSSSSFD